MDKFWAFAFNGPFPLLAFLSLYMIHILFGRICIIVHVVWFIFPLGELVSFCLSYDLYSYVENLYHLLLKRFLCSLYDLHSHLRNLYYLLLERFLDAMLFWTFLRLCYLHYVARGLAKIRLNKNFRKIHTWIISYQWPGWVLFLLGQNSNQTNYFLVILELYLFCNSSNSAYIFAWNLITCKFYRRISKRNK